MRVVVDLIDALDARRGALVRRFSVCKICLRSSRTENRLDCLVRPKIFGAGGKIEVLESLVDDIFNGLILGCCRQKIETKNAPGRLDRRSRSRLLL